MAAVAKRYGTSYRLSEAHAPETTLPIRLFKIAFLPKTAEVNRLAKLRSDLYGGSSVSSIGSGMPRMVHSRLICAGNVEAAFHVPRV